MTAETAGEGLEIPGQDKGQKPDVWLPRGVLVFLGFLLPAILASLVAGGERAGSVIVLCYAFPFVIVLHRLRTRLQEMRSLLQVALTCVVLTGVALEPGWLNMALAWFLLIALAIEARSPGLHPPAAALRAVLRSLVFTPIGITVDAIATILKLPGNPLRARHLPIASLVLPAVAVLVFASLLSAANPVIADIFAAVDFGNLLRVLDRLAAEAFSFEGLVFCSVLLMAWPVLRGRTIARAEASGDEKPQPLWYRLFFKPSAVGITLLLLNALFAVENVLDLQHLWINPAAPGSYNHADDVHRGAYTLIATASLAGLLMMTALRKGSVTEATPAVRKLVYLFAAQNLLLVASSVQRTLLYIDAYGWTEWRVSGLAWMGLVFFGLLTIFWRVVRFRDNRWLVNANIMAAVTILAGFSVWNMQGFIAERNVDRALAAELPELDYHYVNSLSINARPALVRYVSELKQRQGESLSSQERLAVVSELSRAELVIHNVTRTAPLQSDWRVWTLRQAQIGTQ